MKQNKEQRAEVKEERRYTFEEMRKAFIAGENYASDKMECRNPKYMPSFEDFIQSLTKEDPRVEVTGIQDGLGVKWGIPKSEVDVEKLAEAYIRKGKDFKEEGLSEYQNGKMNGFIDGYNQALQQISEVKEESWDEIVRAYKKEKRSNGNDYQFYLWLEERYYAPKPKTN